MLECVPPEPSQEQHTLGRNGLSSRARGGRGRRERERESGAEVQIKVPGLLQGRGSGPGCTGHWPLSSRHSLAAGNRGVFKGTDQRTLQIRQKHRHGPGGQLGVPSVEARLGALRACVCWGQEGFRQRGQRLNSQKLATSNRGRREGSGPRGRGARLPPGRVTREDRGGGR